MRTTLMVATMICLAAVRGRASAQEFIVSPEWLAARANDPRVVVLHVSHGDYVDGHIPGAREVTYDRFTTRRGSLGTELPELGAMRELFESLGVSDSSTVVVYAHEAPMATRALFTLANLGIRRLAYLDGGLDRWRAEGRAVSRERPPVQRGQISSTPVSPPFVATADLLTARNGRARFALLDTRTPGEYHGTGNRSGMPSAGHLDGARHIEWQDLFADRSVRLKDRAELERIYRSLATPGDTVVTYCWVGYRASATWFVARVLGYSALMYDGSYQDWSQRSLPTKAGATP